MNSQPNLMPYWNLKKLKQMPYENIFQNIDYSELEKNYRTLAKELTNVLKQASIELAYIEKENSEINQMEKEIKEFEEHKFGVMN